MDDRFNKSNPPATGTSGGYGGPGSLHTGGEMGKSTVGAGTGSRATFGDTTADRTTHRSEQEHGGGMISRARHMARKAIGKAREMVDEVRGRVRDRRDHGKRAPY